ncbi:MULTISPECIES: MazG family protein [Micrococcaceae]|uniref:MazG family protein n=1 Tax=unclassified Kocuria TaxID=2649579 RepID=UPI001010E34D|nr:MULTISPECIES: MazG family protein [unclassified Kocuria]
MTTSQFPRGKPDGPELEPETPTAAFEELVAIMDRLRSPGGCPWDGEQTHASLVRYLIEESYEVVEAIEAPNGVDRALLQEELGDVLLQVVFHARVAEEVPSEAGGFGIADVIQGLNAKLIRRHPHVFGGFADAEDGPVGERTLASDELETLTRRWDEIKRAEKPERKGPFDGIPPALPALALAEKTLSKAAKASLPLPEAVETLEHERSSEVVASSDHDRPQTQVSPESVAPGTTDDAEEEIGRHLLGVVAHARERGVDPEKALRRAVRHFVDSSGGNA